MGDYLMFIIPIAGVTLFFAGLYAMRGGLSPSNVFTDLFARQYGMRKARLLTVLAVVGVIAGFLLIAALIRNCVFSAALRMK